MSADDVRSNRHRVNTYGEWREHPNVTLTAAEAEKICDALIAMAARLPIKRREHGPSLDLLGWFERRRP